MIWQIQLLMIENWECNTEVQEPIISTILDIQNKVPGHKH